MTRHEIAMGWRTPPLHGNARHTPPQHRRIVAETRQQAGWRVHAAKLGRHQHVTVGLYWQHSTRSRPDGGENLAPLLKACIDGMVDAGVVPDDGPQYVTRWMPELIAPNTRPGGPDIWLVIDTE